MSTKTATRATGPATAGVLRLEAIAVQGFKSHRDRHEIAIRNLTVLAGENSGGKSSVIQPLLLMKQTLDATYDPGVMELNGDCVKVSMAQDLFWGGAGRSSGGKAKEWSYGLKVGGRWKQVFYSTEQGRGLLLRRTTGHAGNVPIEIDSESVLKKVEFPASNVFQADERVRLFALAGLDRVAHHLEEYFEIAGPGGRQELKMPDSARVSVFPLQIPQQLIHIPGLRGNPERSYPTTRISGRFPGRFPPYTAAVLNAWKTRRDMRLKQVGDDLRRLGLTWKVDTRAIDDTTVELKVGRLREPRQGGASDLVNIADVGFGASQVLPVVVALRVAAPGQLVHIEQPELHLHPNAQVRMADLLLDAARRGVQVIIETHSSVLLKAIQVAVAEDESGATRELVALHWVSRDADGASSVRTADLKANGTYGDWPVDFADVELDIERRLIIAASRPRGAA